MNTNDRWLTGAKEASKIPLTTAQMDAILFGIYTQPKRPDIMLMSATARIAFVGYQRGWDRRRIKREMRKGAKSTYDR